MSIKYEIQSIKNAQGTGEERHFARIFEYEPMTDRQLAKKIQASCSLTEGDIAATLSALRETMIYELSHGNRFFLPGIGYFSLSAEMNFPKDKPIEKVRGNNICVRNIKFRPEASMLQEIKGAVRFERADYSTQSKKYTEEEMLEKIKTYFATSPYINRRIMELTFGLRQSAALKWLQHFTKAGILLKEGARNSPVYFLNK